MDPYVSMSAKSDNNKGIKLFRDYLWWDPDAKSSKKLSENIVSYVSGGFASKSKSQPVTIPEVNMKKKLLQELASLQLLQKKFEQLSLELILRETDPVEKAKKEETLENVKSLAHKFVRDILQDSSEKGKQKSLVDEVKDAKTMAEQCVSSAQKEIEKAEKKKTKLQV